MTSTFCSVQLRRPHISSTVADEDLIDPFRFGAVGQRDAFVVDLYHLAGFQIVVNDHLLGAADQRAPDFHRRQPVDVKMRDQIAVEEAVDVRDVFGLTRARGPFPQRKPPRDDRPAHNP